LNVNIYIDRQAKTELKTTKYKQESKHNKVKTGDTDEQDDEQVADGGSEFRCGDKRILGSVVQITKTEWCRRRL